MKRTSIHFHCSHSSLWL